MTAIISVCIKKKAIKTGEIYVAILILKIEEKATFSMYFALLSQER